MGNTLVKLRVLPLVCSTWLLMKFPGTVFFLLALTSLTACTPVAEGQWLVTIELAGPDYESTWRIESDGSALLDVLGLAFETEVDFAGSRFSWSADVPVIPAEPEPGQSGVNGAVTQPANFGATVNGGRFSGTLYTTAGNLTVRGRRQ